MITKKQLEEVMQIVKEFEDWMETEDPNAFKYLPRLGISPEELEKMLMGAYTQKMVRSLSVCELQKVL